MQNEEYRIRIQTIRSMEGTDNLSIAHEIECPKVSLVR